MLTRGTLGSEEKGGTLVVVLHGWGARGDDLVSLARELEQARSRFLIPAAPLSERGGGRAWWHLPQNRPPRAESDAMPEAHRPHPQVTAAREAVRALVREARQRYAPESVALVGFSQGSMLALDVALCAEPLIDRVAVLSGYLMVDSLPALHARAHDAPRPAVLVAHGRNDSIVPFQGGEGIRTILEAHDYPVTWLPFDGGHEIPSSVVARLRKFLFEGPSARG